MLSAKEVAELLSCLCTRLGFCLRRDAEVRLAEDPPADVHQFTAAVFVAEGLDPLTADRRLYRQVTGMVTDAFRRSEERQAGDVAVASQWAPMSSDAFAILLGEELAACSPEERLLFEQSKITVERRPFAKPTYLADAFVIAAHRDEVIYYNDIEGGFNTSPVNRNGAIVEYWCNQDTLQGVLYRWLQRDDIDSESRASE